MNYDLLSSKLESKTPIATGVVSDTGWSKHADFREYFSSLCYSTATARGFLALLMDTSPIFSVESCKWALQNGIIFFN